MLLKDAQKDLFMKLHNAKHIGMFCIFFNKFCREPHCGWPPFPYSDDMLPFCFSCPKWLQKDGAPKRGGTVTRTKQPWDLNLSNWKANEGRRDIWCNGISRGGAKGCSEGDSLCHARDGHLCFVPPTQNSCKMEGEGLLACCVEGFVMPFSSINTQKHLLKALFPFIFVLCVCVCIFTVPCLYLHSRKSQDE